VRAAKKVNIFIETWLKLGENQNPRIPDIPWGRKGDMKVFRSVFEDIWFYTAKYFNEDISNVNLEKIS
jgi:hypothetical protein